MAVAEKVVSRGYGDAGIEDLRARLQGELIEPDDRRYERARATWNGAVSGQPALIVRCADAVDVAAAIAFAREQGLPVAVRSGGHSMAGHSTCDGVVIDLSPMKGIEIDPSRRVARIEPGLTWGEVAAATQPHGLAISSGDTASVGVGGLALGGGIGWMVRKHGLAIDNLRSVELVTADGRFLRASAAENAELFWGLRGGGGNFGVATAFEFDLHPAGIVLGGAVFYDAADADRAEDILRAYARLAAAAPDELTTQALLMLAPPAPFIPPDRQGRPVVAIAVCYAGDLAEGERAVAPLRRLATPIADVIGPMPYPAIFALTRSRRDRGAAPPGALGVPGLARRGLDPRARGRVRGDHVPRDAGPAARAGRRDGPGGPGGDRLRPPRQGAHGDDHQLRTRLDGDARAARSHRAGVGRRCGPTPRARTPTSWATRATAASARPTRRRPTPAWPRSRSATTPTNLFRLNQNIAPR